MPTITAPSIITRCIASGLGFTEGPVWTRRGTLQLVGLSRGLIYDLDPATGEILAAVQAGGAPNGLAEDAAGTIWIAQKGDEANGQPPAIQMLSNGVVTTVSDRDFHAPNDLVTGPDGRIWFTDPQGHDLDAPILPGRIWSMHPVSHACRIEADGLAFPNGLAFSADGKSLFVAETMTSRIVRFDCTESGIGTAHPHAVLPEGRPDGIAFDRSGRLHVAATDAAAVMVFDCDGELVERLELPGGYPTNLCFGGEGLRTLFVTSAKGGKVYAIDREIAGLAPGPR
ncbi:SMP-30/gluconolactonase/LRE family protein [Sphingomonas sp. AOB5]|uniref:SMP-30/gluconolactonase/LRE family protein n=1 Tax=Sphingomonas sp. AOB5 TaxID=3034017 RepID=UPI0023F94065|nr:SMP-30/gluconolactonase/LRE family protein [Sphingomonas sp. AOB5]MDF7774846.1 SMP-30/gluconolactonase/LRE family protein [Sphingomonas sp. AOB5]